MIKKILLVIEDRQERETIKHVLSLAGYTIIASESSGSALAAIANHPDIEMIILDWSIEEHDGSSTFDILYSNFKSIPIFVLGEDHSNKAVVSTISMGAVDYLFKPIDKDHLTFMVDNILNSEKLASRNKSTRKQVLFQATSQIELIKISKQAVHFKLNFSIPADTVTVFTCDDLSEILEIPFKSRYSCKVISCEKITDENSKVPYYTVKANFLSLSPIIASKIELALSKNLFDGKATGKKGFIP